jgi:hypothetical protein
MTEEEKARAVRRMLQAGRELPYEQRLALRELHTRFDTLWERWELARRSEEGILSRAAGER